MTNNDILRRLRYALDIKDSTMTEIFKLSEYEITRSNLIDLLKKYDIIASSFGPQTIRFVFHLDISEAMMKIIETTLLQIENVLPSRI